MPMTHSEGAHHLQGVLLAAVEKIRALQPSSFAANSVGEEVVVGLYERAMGLARAVAVLVMNGLADEAAHQVRSLLESSVLLGHTATKGLPLDQVALTIMLESVRREKGEAIGSEEQRAVRRAELDAEEAAILQEASSLGIRLASANLDVTRLAGEIDRQQDVSFVYRRTSGYIHLTRRALGVRMLSHGEGRIRISDRSSPWNAAAMSESAARLVSAAAYSASWLLNWDELRAFESLVQEVEHELEAVTSPLDPDRPYG